MLETDKKKLSPSGIYLDMLGVDNLKDLENSIVGQIIQIIKELSRNGTTVLPIYLARVASSFLIEPKPRIIYGKNDGEIIFDEVANKFEIRLHSINPNITLKELAENTRYRFTYAHEFAHRFFFVESQKNGLEQLI